MADHHGLQAGAVGADGATDGAGIDGDVVTGAAAESVEPEAISAAKSVWLPAVVPLRSRTKRDEDGAVVDEWPAPRPVVARGLRRPGTAGCAG